MPFPARLGTVLLCLAAADASLAEVGGDLESGAGLNPFYLRVGTYFLGSSTMARVDGAGGNFGTRLSFENDLNLDRYKNTLLATARWRVHDRHFLEIEYFNLTRLGSKRIDKEIRFGDAAFQIGADLRSSFTTEVTRLGYSYRIVKRPEWGLALSAGVHVTRLRTSLDTLNFDSLNPIDLGSEIASVTAPLPVFGVSAARRLGDKWILSARTQWFFLKVDHVEGYITHAAAYLEHDTFRNLGFGFGYDWFGIAVDTTDEFWQGNANVHYNGPLVFVKASF